MPGFKIGGQGEGPSSTTETRRKHRWVWTSLAGSSVSREILLLLKSAQRPKVILEEPVLHHNQEQVYFAGKQSWDPIELTFYDAEQSPDSSEGIWDWYNKIVEVPSANVLAPDKYKLDSSLEMKGGDGSRRCRRPKLPLCSVAEPSRRALGGASTPERRRSFCNRAG